MGELGSGSQPRILHVAQPTTEGVAVVVADLVGELVRRGWSVTVACPTGGYLEPRVREAGARHGRWEATRTPGWRSAPETRSLRRIIAQTRPDVVHLHSSKAGLAGRLALRGRLPTVFSPHAWSFLHAHGLQGTLALRWEQAATRWTDVILCGSLDEVATGEAAGIRGNYEMISNSIESPPSTVDRRQARVELQLPLDAPMCVCLGRLTAQKGQDVLLRGWPAVRRAVPEARLILVGDGPDRVKLESMSSPGVQFAGAALKENVPLWIAAADVLAFPSRWETLSLAVLESLAGGRAVIVSDCSGMSEAMAGGAGRMVPVDDVEGFAQAVVDYLGDLRFCHAEGERSRAAFEHVHETRRRENLDRYARLLDGLRSA